MPKACGYVWLCVREAEDGVVDGRLEACVLGIDHQAHVESLCTRAISSSRESIRSSAAHSS